jgi:HNH endonuclease
MVCDTGFYLVATGAKGEPLYESALLRYFTQAQRRAMIARDGDRCVAVGCRKRAAGSHAHHVVFWKDGGKTDIDNGVLLCPAHHHALHQGAFQISMIDGMPHIRAGIVSWDDSAWRPASRNRLLAAETT